MLLASERQMTFEEIEERARELFSHANPDIEWYFLDEGDRNHWRERAVEESKAASSKSRGSSHSYGDYTLTILNPLAAKSKRIALVICELCSGAIHS
jgi:hypothetical protein